MTEILKTATKRRRKVKVKFITVTNVFIGLCAILQFSFCFKKFIIKLSAEEKSTDQINCNNIAFVCYNQECNVFLHMEYDPK